MSWSETREKAARTKEVLTSIGRGLREQYDPAQPFSERLARLVGKIRSTRDWKTEKREPYSTD
jgi:hypothetical protein